MACNNCNPTSGVDPRIAGRTGSVIRLGASFYKSGDLADPYAIRQIDIYRGSTAPDNLVLTIPMPDPDTSEYPFPVVRTDTGEYYLDLEIPEDWIPDGYFDVWRFIADDPMTEVDLDNVDLWMSKCLRFWVYKDSWYLDDCLETIRFSFEPLDIKFKQPEKRNLEVGLMPLPLYDYNYNLITPQIPHMKATITIYSLNCEVLVQDGPMCIGLRQGTYRSNPFVFQYMMDTSNFLIGTYRYRVTVTLPNGETRVSDDFNFEVM